MAEVQPVRCPKCGRVVHPMALYPNDAGCGCTPRRIQRKRTKGWTTPLCSCGCGQRAIYVGRPTKWGNPFFAGGYTHLWHRATTHPYDFYRDHFAVVNAEHAANLYRAVLTDPERWRDDWGLPTGWEDHLRGHDLACWCPLDQPCHADVLLELCREVD